MSIEIVGHNKIYHFFVNKNKTPFQYSEKRKIVLEHIQELAKFGSFICWKSYN